MQHYFGTDGIRGRVGQWPITPDFIVKLGVAVGSVLAEEGAQVLIGKDTRLSGYMLESALVAGLSYAGINVAFTGPLPTPGIAYLTRTLGMSVGCVISASHNPYDDNGIKFFSHQGTKLDDAIEHAIEEKLHQLIHHDLGTPARGLGKARRIVDANGRYIEFCKSTANGLDLKGLKIVLDCAHGATYQVAPAVFRELGATIITIGVTPDGFNINHGVGSTHPELLQKTVIEEKADLGIAFDGDGDRVLLVDHEGHLLDGDDLLYILAKYTKPRAVVGTLMTNYGLENALQVQSIGLIRAKVGDRYVMEQLKAHDLLLGGENSGHIICRDKHHTGDGIIAALQVLQVLQTQALNIKDALEGYQKYPQVMLNVKLTQGQIWQTPSLQSKQVAIEQQLAGKGRVLIRASGTEPVVRVMVEGVDAEQCRHYAETLVSCIEQG